MTYQDSGYPPTFLRTRTYSDNSEHFLNTFYVSGTELNTLYTTSHLIVKQVCEVGDSINFNL